MKVRKFVQVKFIFETKPQIYNEVTNVHYKFAHYTLMCGKKRNLHDLSATHCLFEAAVAQAFSISSKNFVPEKLTSTDQQYPSDNFSLSENSPDIFRVEKIVLIQNLRS